MRPGQLDLHHHIQSFSICTLSPFLSYHFYIHTLISLQAPTHILKILQFLLLPLTAFFLWILCYFHHVFVPYLCVFYRAINPFHLRLCSQTPIYFCSTHQRRRLLINTLRIESIHWEESSVSLGPRHIQGSKAASLVTNLVHTTLLLSLVLF